MRQSSEECLELQVARDELKKTDPETESRIYDVSFTKLMKDPVNVIKDIYDHFGYDFTPEFEENLRLYIESHPKGQHGKFNYSLDTFNLTKEDVNNEFADYLKQYSKYF